MSPVIDAWNNSEKASAGSTLSTLKASSSSADCVDK